MSTNNIKSSNGAINNNNNNETTSLRSSLVQQAEAHTSSRTALEESLNIKSSAKGNTLSRPSLSSVKNGGGDLRMGAVSSPSHRHSTTSTNFRASSKPDADNNINVQSSSRHSLLLNNSNSKIVQIDTIATSDYTTTNNNNITSNDTARTSGIIPKSSSNRNLPAANTSRNTVREGDGGGDFGPATGPQLSSVNEEDQAATGTPLLHRNSSTTLSRKQGGVNEPPSFKAGGDVTTSSNNINRNASIHSIIMERVNNSIHSLKESGSGVKTEEGGVGGQQALSKNNNESRHSISKNNAALATGDQDNIAGVSDTTRRFSSIQNPKNVTDLKTLTMSPKSSQTQLAVARSPRSSTRHLNENGYTKIISAPKVSVQKATLERSRRKQQASHASGINSDTDESAPKTKKSKSRANIMNNTASDQSSSSGGGSSSSDYEDASENEEEVDDGGVPVKSSYDNRKQQKHMSTFEYLKDSDFKNSYNAGSSTKNTHNQQSSSMYQSSKSPRALAVPVAEGGNRFRAVGGGATRQTVEAIKRSVHVENTSSGNLGAKILNQSHSSDLRQNEIIQKLLRNDRVQHRGGGGGGERGHGPGREGGGGGHDGVSQNNKYRINKQPSNQNLMSQNASQNALNTDNYNQGLPAGDRHRQQQQEDNYQQQILGDLGAGYDQEKMYRDRQADTYASQTFDFIDNNIKEPGQRRAINGGTLARRGKSYDTLYGSRANTISQSTTSLFTGNLNTTTEPTAKEKAVLFAETIKNQDIKSLRQQRDQIERELQLARRKREIIETNRNSLGENFNGHTIRTFDEFDEEMNGKQPPPRRGKSLKKGSDNDYPGQNDPKRMKSVNKSSSSRKLAISSNNTGEDVEEESDDITSEIHQQLMMMRAEYLRNGGNNQGILSQIRMLEKEAASIKRISGKGSTSIENVKSEPTEQDINSEIRRLKAEHEKYMLKISMEKERLTTENELTKLKTALGIPVETKVSDDSGGLLTKFNNRDLITNENRMLSPMEFDQFAVPLYAYDSTRGMCVFWDFVSGLPFHAADKHIQMVHAHFEGAQPKGEAKTFNPVKCQGDPGAYLIYAPLGQQSDYINIPPKSGNRVIIELQMVKGKEGQQRGMTDFRPLGWTSLDFFTLSTELEQGRWVLPIFPPPVNFLISTQKLYQSVAPIPGIGLYIRVVDMSQKGLYKRVQYDPVTHRTFFKPKKGGAQSSNATAAGEYEYHDTMLQNRKIDNLWSMDEARRLMEEQQAQPAPKPEIAQVEISQAVAQQKIYEGPTFAFKRFGLQLECIEQMVQIPYPKLQVEIIGQTEFASEHQVLDTFLSEHAEGTDTEGRFSWCDSPQRLVFEDLPVTPETTIAFKIMIQENHLGPYRMYALGTANLDSFISSNNIREVKVFKIDGDKDKAKAEPFVVKVKVFKVGEMPDWKPFTPKLVYPKITKEAWVDIDVEPQPEEPFQKGDGFDIYIDGARFLPSNAVTSKITGRVFNRKAKQVDPEGVDAIMPPDSEVFCPEYKCVQQYRDFRGDSTSMFVFKVYILDKFTSKMRLCGSAAIHLFLDKKTLDQPQKSVSNYYINAGGHQIPVFAGTPALESPLSMAKFEEMKRVPCCTLLVRIVPVKYAEKARSSKPPVYGNGDDYDTSLSFPNPNEINLYQLVCAERPTMFIGDVIPAKKNQTNEKLSDWISVALTKSIDGVVWENESQYLLKYDTRAGFKVIIDSAFKLKVKGVGFLHTQLMDDAIKVSDKNTAHDDHPFQYLSSKIDFKNSTITGPYFLDYAYWSRGHAYNPNSYLLFQVLSVPRSGKDTVQATPCGWSVCSIFDNQEYVYFGYFQLPLFEGSVPPKAILDRLKSQNVLTVINEALAANEISYVKGNGSIFLRLCDARRVHEFEAKFRDLTPNLTYMPSKNKNLMSQMLRKRDGGSTIDASIPDDANPVEYIRQITPFVRKQVVLFNKVVEAKK